MAASNSDNLIKQSKNEKKEIFKSLNKLFIKSDFILGDEVDIFEILIIQNNCAIV